MIPRNLNATECHESETDEYRGIHNRHWPFNGYHTLAHHDREYFKGKKSPVPKKDDLDNIDEGRQNESDFPGKVSVSRFDENVSVFPRRHGRSKKTNAYQEITGHFFGPHNSRVENVAGKELRENNNGKDPK